MLQFADPLRYFLKLICVREKIKKRKKVSIVPIHKKVDKQTVIKYHIASLLHNCGKISERLLYNEIFNFFIRK